MRLRICKLCISERLVVDDAKKIFIQRLLLSTTINTIITVLRSLTSNSPAVMQLSQLLTLGLLWLAFPFGVYAFLKSNAGFLILFVTFGICCAAAKTTITLVVLSIVASSCESDQISFKGCYAARNVLTCLETSSCTSDAITDFNDNLPTGYQECHAWGTDTCDSSGSVNHLGFTGATMFSFLMELFVTCVPVYSAFIYLLRLEGSRVGDDNNIKNGGSDDKEREPLDISLDAPLISSSHSGCEAQTME
eukprot:TRINITY_DN688_c0_g1_i1.p1 TRINITY_DN688_c0_g1~~TRINITY_DN688_c0_g1_i1.p1  ORF type:complete len:249 (+),score=43.69 TRINITY_DN688_c0_g1_i1:631-1377(+)